MSVQQPTRRELGHDGSQKTGLKRSQTHLFASGTRPQRRLHATASSQSPPIAERPRASRQASTARAAARLFKFPNHHRDARTDGQRPAAAGGLPHARMVHRAHAAPNAHVPAEHRVPPPPLREGFHRLLPGLASFASQRAKKNGTAALVPGVKPMIHTRTTMRM